MDAAGDVAGYADAVRAAFMAPGSVQCTLVVAPARRGGGAGTLLLAAAEGLARNLGAAVLQGRVPDNDPAALRFAARRGYETERHMFDSMLDLAAFDPVPFAGTVQRLQAAGIRFFTLADAPGEATERALMALEQVSSLDDPAVDRDRPAIDFTEWRRWHLEMPGSRPECVILAAAGERLVGTTIVEEQAPETMYTRYTGVDRALRRRGLALALKLLGIQAARRRGARWMRTDNDSRNAAMLAVNRKLGYMPAPGLFFVRKWLTPSG